MLYNGYKIKNEILNSPQPLTQSNITSLYYLAFYSKSPLGNNASLSEIQKYDIDQFKLNFNYGTIKY